MKRLALSTLLTAIVFASLGLARSAEAAVFSGSGKLVKAPCIRENSDGTRTAEDCIVQDVTGKPGHSGIVVNGKEFQYQAGKCYYIRSNDTSGDPSKTNLFTVLEIDCSSYDKLLSDNSNNPTPIKSYGGTYCPTVGTPGLNIDCTSKNPIYGLLQFAINWITGILVAYIVYVIVRYGAIGYITAQGNPEGIKEAKTRLSNAIIGLILLSLMFVILRAIGIGQ